MELIDLTDGSKKIPQIKLLRHARAPHNKPDEIATFGGGRIDNNLTEEGVQDTVILARNTFSDGPPDVILSSRMKRSKQTADILVKELGKIEKGIVPVITIDDLEEVDVGDFTGHTEDEARQIDRDSADYFYTGDVENWSFPNGDSYDLLARRVKNVISQVKKIAKKYDKIWIVGHGMFNRVFLHELYKEKIKLWQPRSYPHDRVINIEIK